MNSRPPTRFYKLSVLSLYLSLAGTHSTHTSANEVYHWIDESGKAHYSQHRPTGAHSERIKVKNNASSDAENAQKQLQEKRNQRLLEEQSRKNLLETQPNQPQASEAECEQVKQNLKVLTSGKRVKQETPEGEEFHLNEAQIAENQTKNQDFLENHCQ